MCHDKPIPSCFIECGSNSLFWVQPLSSHAEWMWPLCALGSDPSTTSAKGGKKDVDFNWHASVCTRRREPKKSMFTSKAARGIETARSCLADMLQTTHPAAGSAPWTQIQLLVHSSHQAWHTFSWSLPHELDTVINPVSSFYLLTSITFWYHFSY